MFSYAFMKMLEARQRSYDRGIAWLSRGESERVKHRIVEEHVRPGVRLLDIGAGTGTLAVLGARRGARVVGFDVSAGMLGVAREKVAGAGLSERVELREMGIGRMDVFGDESFDVVSATLVLSELDLEGRRYALRHAHRVLRRGGKLVVADEVLPRRRLQRLLHGAARAPLALLSAVLCGRATRAARGIEALVAKAGFEVERVERSSLDAFIYLVAARG